MKRFVVIAGCLLSAESALGGKVEATTDSETGWKVYTLEQGATVVKVAPAAGANVFSIEVDGVQLLRQPEKVADLPGVRYGVPVLYPTPNRVRDSKFTFEGRDYVFDANERTHFIHGLVHKAEWEATTLVRNERQASLTMKLEFKPGTAYFEKFPIEHSIWLQISVADGGVQWRYTVDNKAGQKSVPFGFGLHPWFLYQGDRADAYVSVPATHWMEAEGLLPTGKLVDLDDSDLDLRTPRSLEGFVIDDVFYGVSSAEPSLIDFRDKNLQITLQSSPDFTHMVVYTPEGKPWFCVENQTCSTDAHNLYSRGLKRESNLLIAKPGEIKTGFVRYRIHKK